MDFDKEKNYILKNQKCQRNWDLSKKIPEEHINYFLWLAQNAPSKQHEAYYDVFYIKKPEVIKELSNYTWGNTSSRNPPACKRNSQMAANFYIQFVCKVPPTMQNSTNDGKPVNPQNQTRWDNAVVSVGIAIGLILRAAAELGYSTGCNKSNSMGPDCNFYWEKRMGIYDDVRKYTKKMFYGIGIGYPQEGRPRWESDDTEYCIGSANGHNLTALNETDKNWKEINPITKEPYRKVKIVDIKKTRIATDPYGNTHTIPKMINFNTHSKSRREIKCKEII
tara:strand:+ start:160 stop:996 length:837 start_codon:yes stop_codon:yes gene_type:complete